LTSDDITRLFRLEARRMTGFFVCRTHDPETALDLVAETFATVVRDRRRFRGSDDEAALAWMYAIARNLLNGWYRRGAVERAAMTKLGIVRPEIGGSEHERLIELAGLVDERARVAEQLGELPERQRVAVHMRVVGERSYEDVARALGISQQAARARVSRGLRTLAAGLAEVRTGG
jgi:RNA polymerase sigma factor (sigma-70 family)